jgi:hypothetical protein
VEFDNRWGALMHPGVSGAWFDRHGHSRFDLHASSYAPINAWWLAEISRLVYKQESDEIGSAARGPTRDQILRNVGLREAAFINEGGTQCALVRSDDESETPFAVLAFRGTDSLGDWATNLDAFRLRWASKGIVHRGFGKALLSVWGRIEKRVEVLDAPLFITGHSLGAALATLASSLRPPRALYTFGCPLIGDDEFAASMEGQRAYRVVNNLDVVTALPPRFAGFRHAGELRYIARDGRTLASPSPEAVAADRVARSRAVPPDPGTVRPFAGPPQPLADHAPVNYVAHLEREVEVGASDQT